MEQQNHKFGLDQYYKYEPLYESSKSIIYRAEHCSTNKTVVLKFLKNDYPTLDEINEYKKEYHLISEISSPVVIKAIGIERINTSLVICLEDIGGSSLAELINVRSLNTIEFLKIAIKCADAISCIHSNNIIHNYINPTNIIYNPTSGELRIIDFGGAALLQKGRLLQSKERFIDDDVTYISPEQTGRSDVGIDYRTDLYSMGATLYRILTNKEPFQYNEPIKIIYGHIAIRPPEPCQVNPNIPKVISRIVMKLLSKVPSDRYQSSFSLKDDLEKCLSQLVSHNNIQDFLPGETDFSDLFVINDKLYGREEETELLNILINQVIEGKTRIALISGKSGIGKTALVNDVLKDSVSEKALILKGKFELNKQNIPYYAFENAFQDIVGDVLSLPEEKIEYIKKRLTDEIGDNIPLIVNISPDIKSLVACEVDSDGITITGYKERVTSSIQKLIRILCEEIGAVIIFLDDLQWSDFSSLSLIQELLLDFESHHLLIIGTYRDQEITSLHPFNSFISAIQDNSEKLLTKISLSTLGLSSTNQIISDTLSCPLAKCSSLSEVLHSRSNGNAFYIRQLLETFSSKSLFWFDYQNRSWNWNISQIKQHGITNDVAELMLERIENLDASTQNMLKIAACIGNVFELEVLNFVCRKGIDTVFKELEPAISAGLLIPIEDDRKNSSHYFDESEYLQSGSNNFQESIYSGKAFQFIHDRVHQTALDLLSKPQENSIHYVLGKQYLKMYNQGMEVPIFRAFDHLNKAVRLLQEHNEINSYLILILEAAKKAKRSAAFVSALSILEAGSKYLHESLWTKSYTFTVGFYIELLEIYYLNSKYEKVTELSNYVLEKSTNVLDNIYVYKIQIQLFNAISEEQKAIDTAVIALNSIGIDIYQDSKNIIEKIKEEKNTLDRYLLENSIESLASLPEMEDPIIKVAVEILQKIIASTIITNFMMHIEVVLIQINLCIQYGSSPQASCAYVFYGSLLCSGNSEINIFRDLNLGNKFGKLAISLLEKYKRSGIETLVTHIYHAFIWHYKNRLRSESTLNKLAKSVQLGIDSGDYQYATFASASFCLIKLIGGFELGSVFDSFNNYTNLMLRLKQYYSYSSVIIFQNLVVVLRESPIKNDPLLIGKNEDDERKYLSDTNIWVLLWLCIAKLIFHIISGQPSIMLN